MHSSHVVAGIGRFGYFENNLTRRANQGYDCIIPQFVKTPNALLRSTALLQATTLPKIEAAPQRVIAFAWPNRPRLRCARPEET
jgi:hypothetical protein